MLTKEQSTILITVLTIVIVVVALISGMNTQKSNTCNQEVIQLFINRSHIEFQSLEHLSNRNVNFIDKVEELIQDNEGHAIQYQEKGMNELQEVYGFTDDVDELNLKIINKKKKCEHFYSNSYRWNLLLIILLSIQLSMGVNVIRRTIWKKPKK